MPHFRKIIRLADRRERIYTSCGSSEIMGLNVICWRIFEPMYRKVTNSVRHLEDRNVRPRSPHSHGPTWFRRGEGYGFLHLSSLFSY